MTLLRMWRGRAAAALVLGLAQPTWADPNVPGTTMMQATGMQSGTASWPAMPVGAPNPLYVRGTGAGSLALDSSLQSLLTTLNAGLTVSWNGQSVGISGTLPAFAAPPTVNLGTLNGVALASNQTTEIASLATIAANSGTQATAANQASGNASAATTASNTGTTATNTTSISGAAGAPSDAAYSGSGNSSIVAALKGIYAKLGSSLAVTGTFWQAIQPVSIAQTMPGTTNGVVVNNGSTGLDYSANKPALPNIAASPFGGSSPYSAYVLVATVPANTGRAFVDIENNSGNQIVIVRDDGTASSGSAPSNASVFPVTGGSGAASQGGSYSSSTFKGRLQIYAASSTSQVAVMVE